MKRMTRTLLGTLVFLGLAGGLVMLTNAVPTAEPPNPGPAAAVQKPQERIERDPATAEFGLWPTVRHSKIGEVRVDGLPVRFSETPWSIERGAPCVGEHTEEVLTGLLGLSIAEVAALRERGVV